MAADNGNSRAIRNYADSLESGDGIPMNKEEAFKYFKMGADSDEDNDEDVAFCMYKVGLMYEKGNGTQMNLTEAKKYLKKSAEKGCSKGIFAYGCFLHNKENDRDEALKYFKMAADTGDEIAISTYNMVHNLKDLDERTNNSSQCCLLI